MEYPSRSCEAWSPLDLLTTILADAEDFKPETAPYDKRPKSLKCFLFDPRSRTPERNFPKPITPRLLRRK